VLDRPELETEHCTGPEGIAQFLEGLALVACWPLSIREMAEAVVSIRAANPVR
jgi:hypothetical protein